MSYSLLVLSPANGKRLIAKAVLKHNTFREAINKGTIILALGTTNALIYEELTGERIKPEYFAAGIIKDYLGVTEPSSRISPLVLHKGQKVDLPWLEALKTMNKDSVFIKGANAYDELGLVGVLVGGEAGGTIGQALGTLSMRGIKTIVPIGIEKRVPSVLESARLLTEPLIKNNNMRVGMMVIPNATIINEIVALKILFNVDATLVAAGGMEGYEGSSVLVIKGEDQDIVKAIETIEAVNE